MFRHVIKNAAPTALAVMGLQLGYMLGGSILIETVFSWPGTGLLLNSAIFQRDLPLLQGTILVLALFFVALNLWSTSRRPRSIRASSEAEADERDHRFGPASRRPRPRRAAIGPPSPAASCATRSA